MNKKNLIFGGILILVIVALVFLFFGRGDDRVVLDFSFEDNGGMHCEYGSFLIRGVEWKEDVLEVRVQDNVNCGHEVVGGGYEIVEDELVLNYDVSGHGLADCFDCFNMVYRFEGLEKKDYRVIFMGEEYGRCFEVGERVDKTEGVCCEGLRMAVADDSLGYRYCVKEDLTSSGDCVGVGEGLSSYVEDKKCCKDLRYVSTSRGGGVCVLIG